jgi:DMSO/TMAO reductase YedYZ molybdopterin-dependent catalytic subunit
MFATMAQYPKSRKRNVWTGNLLLKGAYYHYNFLFVVKRLKFHSLVENPLTISLKELMKEYTTLTYPITLVCAGNRRKEQNQVRKTKGFSWGAAGVSTALWTGVAMSEVIRRAKPTRKARYVCMEGADKLVGFQTIFDNG